MPAAGRGSAASWAGGVVAGAVSLLGAGLATHFDYLAVMRATNTTGLTPFSAGGLALAAGLPAGLAALLPSALLVAGTVAAGLLAARGRVGLGFSIAVIAWFAGTPVMNINTPVLLLPALAPLAWPWPARAEAAQVPETAEGSGSGRRDRRVAAQGYRSVVDQ